MIVRIKAEDIQGYGVKAEIKEKSVQMYLRVIVNASNLEESISKFRGNRYVVGFDYEDTNYDVLNAVKLDGARVIVRLNGFDIETLNKIRKDVRVVLRMKPDFSDMRKVLEICKEYPNASFCGGSLLRLSGCTIGCIQASDISGRNPIQRNVATSGNCGCIFPTFEADDLNIEFTSKPETVAKEKTKSSSKSGAHTAKPPKPKIGVGIMQCGGLSDF